MCLNFPKTVARMIVDWQDFFSTESRMNRSSGFLVRVIVSTLAISASFLTITRSDDPPKKPTPPFQFGTPKDDSAAGKELAGLVKSANSALREANESDANKVLVESAERILTHARKHPTATSTFSVLVAVVRHPRLHVRQSADGAKVHKDAVELIKTNFVKTSFMTKSLLASFASGFSDDACGIVREVIQSHPDLMLRARAAKVLIAASEMRVRQSEGIKGSEAVRESLESQVGKLGVQELLDSVPQSVIDIEFCRKMLRTELKGQLPDVEIGSDAPETVSVNLQGKPVRLSELKGKVVVLDFWGVNCGPCLRLIPHIRELVKKNEGKPFVFVGVSIDDEKEELTEFLKKEPMPWTHWWDSKKAVAEQWEVAAYPTLYVIDHMGVIRFKTLSYDPKSEKLDKLIEQLVKDAEASK
jgi:thiol-disulfide isomerase/thioredoxin